MQGGQVPAAPSLGAGARLCEAVLPAGGSRGRSGHWLSPGPGAGPLLSDGAQAAHLEDQGSQSTRLLLVDLLLPGFSEGGLPLGIGWVCLGP